MKTTRFVLAWQGALLACLCSSLLPVLAAESQSQITLPEYKVSHTANGMTLLLMERHQLPLVSFVWIMKSAGSVSDPDGREGLASLTADLLRKGTKTRSADQISEALDFVGASLDAGATLDYAAGSAQCVSRNIPLLMEILSDVLLNPTFPEDEVTKLIKQDIDGIAEAKATPNAVIGNYFARLLYGSHPYARPSAGTETTLAAIKQEEIAAFFQRQYTPNQMLLAVVGDFATADMEKLIDARFGAWQPKSASTPALKPAPPVQGRRALLVTKPDATQTFFRLGNIGLSRTNQDWVPLQVINTLFGGRFTSMINTELRIKSGLTYGARSSFSDHPLPGSFALSSFTKNDTTERALEITLEVLKTVHEKGITAEQLQSAKTYIKGQFGPTLETNDQLAHIIAELEYYGLGPDYINHYFDRVDSVTLEDSRRLIEKYFPLENFVMVLIGQEGVIAPAAEKITRNIEKKPITAPGY